MIMMVQYRRQQCDAMSVQCQDIPVSTVQYLQQQHFYVLDKNVKIIMMVQYRRQQCAKTSHVRAGQM